MARKEDLRRLRAGTVINLTSSRQESDVMEAVRHVAERLAAEFKVPLVHERQWKLTDVVARLRGHFPDVPFAYHFESSAMRPDGGILSMVDRDGEQYPILIVEVKNQGTNDLRALEGKPRQAKGNAIERLGKNVIGFRTAMLSEAIMPFVCFGYGCDFADDSSILDRVVTINMFGPLSEISLMNLGDNGMFNRGSFFFREEKWTVAEMEAILGDVGMRSIHYYFAKLGPDAFVGNPS